MRRHWQRVAIGMTVLAVLTGCVAIPTSSGVQIAELDTDPDEVPNVALPEGPSPGQTQEEILQGFIRAGRGPQGGYNIARQYLAPDAAWSGTERVLVTSSPTQPVRIDDDTLALTITVVGEVDATGRYTARPPQQQTLTYDMTIVDGENRIARPDAGTVLSPNGFANAFAEYPLYFYGPAFDYLVPDLRWFPSTTRVADRILRELLAGPSPWLASPVVVSAFPTGTSGEALISAPRITVDLDSAVRAESPVTQRRMAWQIQESLRVLGNVTDVTVTADGLELAPADDGTAPDARYLVHDVVGGLDGVFGALGGDGGVTPLATIERRADTLSPVAASLARDRESVAVLSAAGVSLVGAAGEPVPIDDRPGLLAPSLDPHGFVWTVPADDPAGLRATRADGVPHPVPLPLDGTVVAVEVARDGARLLVAIQTPGGPRVFVAGIQRDANLVPIALGAFIDLPADARVLDAAWVDGVRVAVLFTSSEATRVDVLPLGGPTEPLGTVDGVQIVGGNGPDGIRVLSADGMVMSPRAAGGWSETGQVASFLGTRQ